MSEDKKPERKGWGKVLKGLEEVIIEGADHLPGGGSRRKEKAEKDKK